MPVIRDTYKLKWGTRRVQELVTPKAPHNSFTISNAPSGQGTSATLEYSTDPKFATIDGTITAGGSVTLSKAVWVRTTGNSSLVTVSDPS